MIRTVTKKITSVFLVLAVCLSLIPAFSLQSFAADGIQMRLEILKGDYPTGAYWNHRVSSASDSLENVLASRNEKFAANVTGHPCTDHESNGETGSYECNYFDGGYQCHGFAAKLFYEIFGIRQSEMEKISNKVYNIQPGDLVRLKNDSHTAIVLSVDGLKFTVAECNVGTLTEEPCCEISWGRSLWLTDITYYVHADNYEQVKNDTTWKSFSEKTDLGNSFYASVTNSKNGKALTASDSSSVTFSTYKGTANQVWKFTKLSDKSYRIQSCLNSSVLTLDASGTIRIVADKGAKNQSWGIFGKNNSLYFSADSSQTVLQLSSDSSATAAKKTDAGAQLFTVEKKLPPSASSVTAKGGINTVSLSWTKSANTTSYTVEIFSGEKLYKSYKKITVNSGKVTLPAGNYSVKVSSHNAFATTSGNTAHFTVSDKNALGKPAKITSEQSTSALKLSWTQVPGATGYHIYYLSSGKWKTVADTAKTSHTFKNLSAGTKYTFAIRAYKTVLGKQVRSDQYDIFTAATKTKAPTGLSAKQSTSAIRLDWSKVKNAEGYRIYYKTSSGWVSCATVTGTTHTFSKLPSGRTYTFAVRPYIKTDLGVVWSDYTTLKTATKPKAPEVRVENVRKVGAELYWSKVEGAEGYQVYYKLDGDKSYTRLANYKPADVGVQLSNLTYNTYYTFAVRAYKKVDGGYVYSDLSPVRFRAVYI